MNLGLSHLSDILLGAAAISAAFYCIALSKRLNRLTGLDQELGGAIALLSQQVDEMTAVMEEAQNSMARSRDELRELTERAEQTGLGLEVLLSSSEGQPSADKASEFETTSEETSDTGGLKDGATSLFVRHSNRVPL